MPPETLRALLDEGRRVLQGQGIATAALDARLLLQEATGARHEDVVTEPDGVVDDGPAKTYRAMIKRRATGVPVPRILGTREFYGRSFLLGSPVLDPRPDTETLVEAVLAEFRSRGPFTFVDLGTGSGAIAVTLLCEMPQAEGTATDLSWRALAFARASAHRHGVMARLRFAQANWLDDLTGPFDLIVSNPPYIPFGGIAGLPREVREHDPRLALDGGPDGLEAYRRIAASAAACLAPGGTVMVEIGAGQEEAVTAIFAGLGWRRFMSRRDLAGHPRCLGFRFGH